MDTNDWCGRLDEALRRHIRAKAAWLDRTARIPGTQRSDLEQELLLDLWRRRHNFDPDRSAFDIFARMLVRHRAASLSAATVRSEAERRLVPLDDPRPTSNDERPLADLLTADGPPFDREATLALQLDVRHFVAGLPTAMQRCCEALAVGTVSDLAEATGQHRSSVYETVSRIRRRADAAGPRAHLGAHDTSPSSPVSASRTTGDGNERRDAAASEILQPAPACRAVGRVAAKPGKMEMVPHRAPVGESGCQGPVSRAGRAGIRGGESARARGRRDSALAAAMSDPALNRQFGRRWVEPPPPPRPRHDEAKDRGSRPALDDTAEAIRDEWRQGRFMRDGGVR